ncbi:hypothetical protein [Nocardia vermiculata]|uniref:Pyridoxamine 5'-phosphate oxidase putative domain-containing protein n=1 Tax=Nocardia vermiculata TaxID=257274 RepID=A0A846XTI9_9NOCA|nr:hypothetical protein [Nocardia vermiculata]NKY48845.1 hypothetical protein [Nocardia vermiculata]
MVASAGERQQPATEHPELDVLPTWPLDTIAVLSTTDPLPHAIPVSWPVRAGDRRILLSLKFDRGSLARLRERPEVALVILAGGNVALCARGRAEVIADPMPGAEDYVAVAIDVEVIDDHRQGAFEVETGITRNVLDEPELEYLRSRVATLQEMAAANN